MADSFIKAPDETLPYTVDFSTWLTGSPLPGDTIASCVWTVPTGITTVVETNNTTKAVVMLSGGTLRQSYPIRVLATTVQNLVKGKTFTVFINPD